MSHCKSPTNQSSSDEELLHQRRDAHRMSRNHGFVEWLEFGHSGALVHVPPESFARSGHVSYLQISCHLHSALRRPGSSCGGPHLLFFQYLTLNPAAFLEWVCISKEKGLSISSEFVASLRLHEFPSLRW